MKLLILGASYGMLPGVKIGLAGHDVTFVGREDEVAQLRQAELVLNIPMRRSAAHAQLRYANATFVTPDEAEPQEYDFVILAMQEPQFAAPDVANLAARVADSGKPCLSIMNLPPPQFLIRLGIDGDAFEDVYSGMSAWKGFKPEQLSNASPDPQALRMSPQSPGELTVTLASNFKAAPFSDPKHQDLLETLARDMSHVKVEVDGKQVAPPVRLLAHSSVYVPLAKWPMLIAGNCRCLTEYGIRTIAEAVLSDPKESRGIYEKVQELILALGAPEAILVPFDQYAKASSQLTRPSSAARAIANGATKIERIDRLVFNLMQQQGIDWDGVDQINAQIESRLSANQ